ncbi:MAG: hypothetical protein MOB07_11865, partial [Acidobacteria bacterium]|nr:hypothetical protein [Acidobacteriota bacterium]
LIVMALELDGPIHLAAGITAADIPNPAADVTGGIGGADPADQGLCLFRKFEGLTPGLKIVLTEHDAPPRNKIMPDDLSKSEEEKIWVDYCQVVNRAPALEIRPHAGKILLFETGGILRKSGSRCQDDCGTHGQVMVVKLYKRPGFG